MATKAAKTYDAVAEVRQVRDRLALEMASMTPEEKIAFIRREAEEARQERAERRRQRRR
ncbi:MAG: hypothetical protein KGZ60_02475 [Truepera sp.]|nr:hypothetical protein [Truepera sp.]